MQQDVNLYEIRGRVAKMSRPKRDGAPGQISSLNVRIETRSEDMTVTQHTVRLTGDIAEDVYRHVFVGDTIHVSGELRYFVWKDGRGEHQVAYLSALSYQFVAMSEQRQEIQDYLESSSRR